MQIEPKASCEFVFICDKTWEELTPTDDPKVKDCDQCGKTVTFCEDFKELTECAKQQKCVCYFNPEAKVSAIARRKSSNYEYIDDQSLSQAEKNKITSMTIHEYMSDYAVKRPNLSRKEANKEAIDNLRPTMGLVVYPAPNPEKVKHLQNNPNNYLRKKPQDKTKSWVAKIKNLIKGDY